MAEQPIVVLGSGMAGFGAGYALHSAGVPFTCYEKNTYFGGHTRSFRYKNGFVFDEGVHISFSKHERIRQLLAENVDGKYEERNFAIDNYWRGRRISHPVQCNLHGLPVDLIVRIIADFSAAKCAEGLLKGGERQPSTKHTSYADWLYAVYGKTFAETFPIAYGNKYHTATMDQLTTEWIGPRMYQPTLEDLLRGALDSPRPETHYIQTYRYPSIGGFVSYLEALAKKFDIRLNHRLVGIDPETKLLRFSNGETCSYSAVISSIALPDLIPLINDVPRAVLDASRRLAYTSAVLINIGLDRADLSSAATTYFYDEDIVISRVNLPHMFAASNAPPGCGSIQAEVYFSDKYKPLTVEPQELIEPVMNDLRRCDFIRDSDNIMMVDAGLNRYANVIYDTDRSGAVATIHEFLDQVGILYCGRYGNWDHAWTDEAFISGEESARRVLNLR